MTTKLVITVDRKTDDPKMCGGCSHAYAFDMATHQCGAFNEEVFDGERLPQCLAAEHEAGKFDEIRNVLENDYRAHDACTEALRILDEEAP